MTTETLIDSEPQNPDPGDSQPTNGVSERKRTANRANSQKSTGPTSKMGKRVASLNSFKNGYYSAERRLQLMGELDEDPAERERLRKGLYDTYPPGAPLEGMLLDGLTDDFWKLGQLDRLDASVKLRELQRANMDENRREAASESYTVGYVKSEMKKGGLVRQKDSPGKFRQIFDILGQLLALAKSRSGSMDHQTLWKTLYGTDDANWSGEKMFQKFNEGRRISDADCAEVVGFLEDELNACEQTLSCYLTESQPETVAMREARLVTCGGDALILFKEMEVTNRQLDRKLQLLLKVRAERFAREEKEASRKEEEGGKQKAEGRPSHPKGGPDGDHDGGSAEIPPRKPVERGSRQAAEGSRQEEEGSRQSAVGSQQSPELVVSAVDFKNEATHLIDNKGSAPAEIRNEATAGSSNQSAESSKQLVERGGEAAERQKSLAQGASLGVGGRPPSPQEEGSRRKAEGSRRKAEGSPQEAEGASRLGKNGTLGLQPSTLDSLDFFLPRPEDGSHQDEPDERVAFIDGEQLLGPHLVHGGGVGDRSEKANPHQSAHGSALDGRTGVAPLDKLGQHEGNEQVQRQGDDVRQNGAHAAGLLLGEMLQGGPGLAEQHSVPDASQQPVGRRGDDHRQVIRFHVLPTSSRFGFDRAAPRDRRALGRTDCSAVGLRAHDRPHTEQRSGFGVRRRSSELGSRNS